MKLAGSVRALLSSSRGQGLAKAGCTAATRQRGRSRGRRMLAASRAVDLTTDFYPYGLQSLSKDQNPSGTMAAILQRLGAAELEDMGSPSNFVKPQSVFYHLDGRRRRWDVVQSHSSVGIILYHTALDALLLVRQFRPAIYASLLREARSEGKPEPPLAAAFSYELCAGIIDKALSLEETARDEVLEECGYDVPLESVRRVTSYCSAMGISGSRHFMFAMDVDESHRKSAGGGLEDSGEAIEVLALPLSETGPFLADVALPKSAGLQYGLMWLLEERRRARTQ